MTSPPIHQVWNMFQPPLATGSREVRREPSVAQSIATSFTLSPMRRKLSAVTSVNGFRTGWSVGCRIANSSPL